MRQTVHCLLAIVNIIYNHRLVFQVFVAWTCQIFIDLLVLLLTNTEITVLVNLQIIGSKFLIKTARSLSGLGQELENSRERGHGQWDFIFIGPHFLSGSITVSFEWVPS